MDKADEIEKKEKTHWCVDRTAAVNPAGNYYYYVQI